MARKSSSRTPGKTTPSKNEKRKEMTSATPKSHPPAKIAEKRQNDTVVEPCAPTDTPPNTKIKTPTSTRVTRSSRLRRLSEAKEVAEQKAPATPETKALRKSPMKKGRNSNTGGAQEINSVAENPENEPKVTSVEKVRPVKKKKQKKEPQRERVDSSMSLEPSPKDQTVEAQAEQPPAPIMNVTAHRMRKFDYQPSPILCIRATPFACKTTKGSAVAISREDGSVELVSANQKMRTIAVIAGYRAKAVDVMTWVSSQDTATPTLVGASRDGTIFIADWKVGKLVSMTPSGGGGIFALETLPVNKNDTAPALVAAGCEDGSIRIFRVGLSETKSSLDLLSTTPSTGQAPILSLACTLEGTKLVLYGGVADGTIRRYESRVDLHSSSLFNWRSAIRMTLETYGRTISTKAWALKALSDGTLVSADSLGHVSFWDGRTGTLESTFEQNDNKADVLALDVTRNECKVFASGVDSRVVCIERLEASVNAESPVDQHRRWMLTHAQRPHTHDVKAVCVFHRARKNETEEFTELLCTGGVDTKLCTYMTSSFHILRPRTIYPWPDVSPVTVAAVGRIALIRRQERVDLYRVQFHCHQAGEQQSLDEEEDEPLLVQGDHLVGTIHVNTVRNLVCAAMSDDGTYLVLSDGASCLVFALTFHSTDRRLLRFKTIPCKVPSRSSILAVEACGSNRFVLLDATGRVHILSIATEDESTMQVDCPAEASVLQTLELQREKLHANMFFAPCSVMTCNDNKWVAVLRNGWSDGIVDVFRDVGGTFSYSWTVPTLESPPCAMGFVEQQSTCLVVACTNFALYCFSLEEQRLSKWSERAGYPVEHALPSDLSMRNDYPVRITSNPADPSKLLLLVACHPCNMNEYPSFARGSFGVLVAIDLSKPFPNDSTFRPEKHVRTQKRKRALSLSEQSAGIHSMCVIGLRYNSMLCARFLGPDELLIVEQPWLDVVARFPEALHRHVYAS